MGVTRHQAAQVETVAAFSRNIAERTETYRTHFTELIFQSEAQIYVSPYVLHIIRYFLRLVDFFLFIFNLYIFRTETPCYFLPDRFITATDTETDDYQGRHASYHDNLNSGCFFLIRALGKILEHLS